VEVMENGKSEAGARMLPCGWHPLLSENLGKMTIASFVCTTSTIRNFDFMSSISVMNGEILVLDDGVPTCPAAVAQLYHHAEIVQ
jgi:hypothetical protein